MSVVMALGSCESGNGILPILYLQARQVNPAKPLRRSTYFLGAAGLESRKTISMSSSVSTDRPANKVSVKRHCRTAFMAAATRIGGPLADCKFSTDP